MDLYGKEQHFPKLDKMCGRVIRIRNRDNIEESKNALIAMLEDLRDIPSKLFWIWIIQRMSIYLH